MTLAQRAYEGYCEHTGGKSLATGCDLPDWDQLPDPIRDAWHAAILAVLPHGVRSERVEGTLFRRPPAGLMTGRRMWEILSQYVELPACESLTLDVDTKGFVKITTTCSVRNHPGNDNAAATT